MSLLLDIVLAIGMVVGLVSLTPVIAYLWGRGQAKGWADAYQTINPKIKTQLNGTTKEQEEKKI